MKLIDKAKEELEELEERDLTPHGYFIFDALSALVAATEALEQWSKGEDHADKGELAAAAVHYDEAVKLTVAALAGAHKEVQ